MTRHRLHLTRDGGSVLDVVERSTEISIACGAKHGEASDLKRDVDCPECKAALKARKEARD